MEDQLTLEYHGPLVELGRLDSYQTAANILAFSDFLGVLTKSAYGEKTDLRTEIQGFRGQSFDIDFAVTIGGAIATALFATPNAKDIIYLTTQCIKSWIHLQGNPPKSIERQTENNEFKVENQNGEIIYIRADVFNIITDTRAGKSVEQFLKTPLQSGINQVCIRSKSTKEIASANKGDAEYFIPLEIEEPLLENEVRMGVVIESASFKEGNKWKFYDGQTSFYAEIADELFLSKVDSGSERFGKGDVLIVTLRTIQKQIPKGLKTDRIVVEVHEHKICGEQLSML